MAVIWRTRLTESDLRHARSSAQHRHEHAADAIAQLLGDRKRLPRAWTTTGGAEIIDVGPGVVRLRGRLEKTAWQGLVCRLSHGMDLAVVEMDPTTPLCISSEGNNEFVLHVVVAGRLEVERTAEGDGEGAQAGAHAFAAGQASLSIREPGRTYAAHLPAGSPFRVIRLSCAPQRLADDFGLPGGVDRLREVFAAPQVMPLDRAAVKTANEIIGTDPASPLGTMLLEGKALELLGNLMLPWLARAEQPPSDARQAKWQDQQRLATARSLVELHLEDALSIPALAVRVATTETKLRKLYRQHFGVSISEHRMQLRMDRAMKLLQEGLHTVSEIAYLTGYKHHSSFTAAFSSYFGCSPSAINARMERDRAAPSTDA
ncbi:helix-turn-helix transcriptional regulator [Rubrivivax albus]|uniref:AraC family transcriptional regulator n=1 Tax=Rubrivivax albus TaxID=2499835 RepID=A0A3S2U5V6_9BURK|nr:AraC family transcriptional regulator [Rubrivivax albus]RVT54388.1 AraC family transcriptional regulator [Rubrivivax albus]